MCKDVTNLPSPGLLCAGSCADLIQETKRNSPIIMRSDIIKKGFERAPHRSLLRATGSIESESDWDKPFIAVVNSYTDCIPGHAHLNEVGMLIKRLVREAGGVPFIFNTIGVDDGIAMGHGGMKY